MTSPPVDRSIRPDRPHPVLSTNRPVRMVRAENGRVEGRLLKVVSETRVDPLNNHRVQTGGVDFTTNLDRVANTITTAMMRIRVGPSNTMLPSENERPYQTVHRTRHTRRLPSRDVAGSRASDIARMSVLHEKQGDGGGKHGQRRDRHDYAREGGTRLVVHQLTIARHEQDAHQHKWRQQPIQYC